MANVKNRKLISSRMVRSFVYDIAFCSGSINPHLPWIVLIDKLGCPPVNWHRCGTSTMNLDHFSEPFFHAFSTSSMSMYVSVFIPAYLTQIEWCSHEPESLVPSPWAKSQRSDTHRLHGLEALWRRQCQFDCHKEHGTWNPKRARTWIRLRKRTINQFMTVFNFKGSKVIGNRIKQEESDPSWLKNVSNKVFVLTSFAVFFHHNSSFALPATWPHCAMVWFHRTLGAAWSLKTRVRGRVADSSWQDRP